MSRPELERPRLPRPTREQLAAAAGRTIPDVIAPGLDVLFCGINPGLYSAATGHHFARPGNRFWPTLHRSGFTPRQLDPAEQELLLERGLGISNIAARATAGAAELSPAELREGGELLLAKLRRWRPAWVAFLGLGAYRTAFGQRRQPVGPAPALVEGTACWVLPNPSGLNASWTPPRLVEAFRELREVADAWYGSSGSC
jgi:TDG/mug DNA glycosylase family protein